jgi:hypothetical protein
MNTETNHEKISKNAIKETEKKTKIDTNLNKK